jgi:hypothetical protein
VYGLRRDEKRYIRLTGDYFSAIEPAAADKIINEVKPGVLDIPIGELLGNERTLAVLKKHLPELIKNPMLEKMRVLSLKKLTAMGGVGSLSVEKMEEDLEKSIRG